MLADPSCIGAERLAQMSGPGVRALLGRTRELPQEEERARLVREVRGGACQAGQGGEGGGGGGQAGSACELTPGEGS